ncbi:MAG TPA: hypothetical protein VGJ71_11445 [Candidatus Limnocylindrales bacterium]|jgi:hypothetical protein
MVQAGDPILAIPEGRPSRPHVPWRPSFAIVGVAVLANGVALLFHILRAAPLPAALTATWAMGLVAILLVIARSAPWVRDDLLRIATIGIVAGLVSTVAYDASKALLSNLDPAPWNPFDAFRIFGEALIGAGWPDPVIRAVGLAFHASNGTTFGLAFAFLFGMWSSRHAGLAVLAGVAWGLFLETFQLALYPGWMNIRFLDEFRQVSFGGHVVYGACVGLVVRAGIRRAGIGGDAG